MKRLIVLAILLLSASPAFAAFAYRGTFTVQAAQMPASQTDFPFLILWTDNVLKVTGSGGQVTDAQGDDIRPYSTSDCATTPITAYEKVFYDGTAGTVEMWVKATGGVGSTIYLCVGDSGITTDGSSNTTWNSAFVGVYHLSDGTTLDATDATSNANNGTPGANADAAAGRLDGGVEFTGTSNPDGRIELTNNSGLDISGSDWTIEGWVYTGSTTANYTIIIGMNSNGLDIEIPPSGGSYIISHLHADAISNLSTSSLSVNTWYHIAATRTGTTYHLFANGAADDQTGPTSSGYSAGGLYRLGNTSPLYGVLNGKLDEVKISNVVRSANWIASEYNNQNSQSTFWGTVTFEALSAGTGYSLPQGFVRP